MTPSGTTSRQATHLSTAPLTTHMPSPYSWQHSPLPAEFVFPDGSAFRAPPDGIWHRALWGNEKLMAQMGVLLPGWADVFLSANLTAREGAQSLTVAAVRAAMRQLRFEQPIGACKLACDGPTPGSAKPYQAGRLVYETPASDADVEYWLSDVVMVHADAFEEAGGKMDAAVAAVRGEVAAALPTYRPSQLELHCIPSPDGSCLGIVMRCSHVTFDGVGILEALDGVVRRMSSILAGSDRMPPIPWGEEVVRLPTSVIDNLRIPWSAEEEEEKDQSMYPKIGEAFEYVARGDFPTLYTPHPNVVPTYSALTTRSLPANVVKALVQQARLHHCTFFSILHATVLLSTIAVRHTDTTTHLAGPGWLNAVNLRDKGILLQNRDVPSALGWNVLIARDLARFPGDENKPALEDVWTLAREINEQMKEQQDELSKFAHWGGRDTSSCASSEAVQLMGKKDCSHIRSPLLSSMGVIDKVLAPRHGDILVSQALMSVRSHVTGPPTSPGVVAHAYTWQGTMYMNISYPEAVVGSTNEQVDALANEPEAKGSMLGWLNTCMETLQKLSGEV